MANKAGVTLDTVLIQIESDAGKSAGNIDKLAASLSNLKAAVSGGYNPISRLADNLKKLDDNTKNISAISARLKNVGKLAEYVEPLQNIGSMNRLSKAGTNIKNLASSINNLNTKGLVNASKLAEQVESLQTIGAMNNLSKAGDNIRKLSEDAKSIGSLVGRLEGVGAVAEYIQPLQNIGSTKKLATAGENIKKLDNNTQNVPNLINRLSGIGKLAEYIQPLKDIGSTTGLGNAADNIGKISSTMESITPDALENVGRVSAELSSKLSPLAAKLHEIASGYNAISNLAKNYNVSIKTITSGHNSLLGSSKTLVSIFNKLGNAVKLTSRWFAGMIRFGKNTTTSITKPITKVTSKIKQMGFALLSVRSAFTFVRKAIDEYMQMDSELQSSIQNTWRAMGAQLAPVVEYVTNLFHQFVRVIYSIILALTGIDLISRANDKAMKNWGKSTKDTLGSLQKFDDLNVVDFGKGSGDENKLIEMDTIDLSPIQKIMDWVKQLRDAIKDALNTGDWVTVGEIFADGVNNALYSINLDNLTSKFESVATNFGKFLNGALTRLDFKKIAKSWVTINTLLIDSLTALLTTIEFDKVGTAITDIFGSGAFSKLSKSISKLIKSIGDSLLKTLANLDWSIIMPALGDAFAEFFGNISSVFSIENGAKLGVTIKNMFMNIPWKDITDSISNLIFSLLTFSLSTVGNMLGFETEGIITKLTTLWESIKPFGETLGSGLKWFYDNVLLPLADYAFNEFLPTALDLLSNAIKFLDSVIQAAEPAIEWFWDTFLNPLIDVLEIAAISLLEDLSNALSGISTWVNNNEETVTRWFKFLLTFLGTMVTYYIGGKVIAFLKALTTWIGAGGLAKAFGALNIKLIIVAIAIGAIVSVWDDLKKAWGNMNWMEKVASVMGIVTIAAVALAVALGAVQSAWSLGIAAAAIVAGIWAINSAIKNATKDAEKSVSTGQNLSNIGFAGGRAAGGYVDTGQLFLANENGPELIGNIGKKTAVANQNQIIEGISEGVYKAVVAANSGDTTIPIIVNIGNKTVYKEQQRFNKMQNDKYGTTVNL